MSGASSNRNKQKNNAGLTKKSKFSNSTDPVSLGKVLQVKSVKLDTKRTKSGKNSGAKSEDNLRSAALGTVTDGRENGDVSVLEASLVKKIRNLSLNSEGENCAPSTSTSSVSPQTQNHDIPTVESSEENDTEDLSDNFEQYTYGYKQYFQKHHKSIKFTNQVTVLYFNGEDILCESMEPLKKETEQQLRNKEMRKEHLMSKGPAVDNVYLF